MQMILKYSQQMTVLLQVSVAFINSSVIILDNSFEKISLPLFLT